MKHNTRDKLKKDQINLSNNVQLGKDNFLKLQLKHLKHNQVMDMKFFTNDQRNLCMFKQVFFVNQNGSL